MRRMFPVAAIAGALLVPAVALGGLPPPGATARCRDGTYSFSQHRSGTCSNHGGVAAWLDAGGTATTTTTNSAGVATIKLGRTVLLHRRTRKKNCRLGATPDRRCSPGAYYSGLTRKVICAANFHTSTIRDVPQSEKFAVESEYGLAAKHYGRTLEIDHIVSLELGGSNSIANLFPEEATLPGHAPGYHVKDKLENKLHALVCSGHMRLRTAQRQIAADWETLFDEVFGVSAIG